MVVCGVDEVRLCADEVRLCADTLVPGAESRGGRPAGGGVAQEARHLSTFPRLLLPPAVRACVRAGQGAVLGVVRVCEESRACVRRVLKQYLHHSLKILKLQKGVGTSDSGIP